MFHKAKVMTANVNNITMDYVKFGVGKKPFVMLPGISLKSITLSADSIASAYRSFSDKYTVYVFDIKRNISAGYSVEDIAEDTSSVMKYLNISDAYIFGASLGGMVAQCIAVNHPELVKKMILGSTIMKFSSESMPVLSNWIRLALLGKNTELNEAFFEAIYSDEFMDKYKSLLLNMISEATDEEFFRFCVVGAAISDFDYSEKIRNIKADSLVISSKKDKVFQYTTACSLAETIGCDIYIYDGYGHAVYDEAPDYKNLIHDFFSKGEN